VHDQILLSGIKLFDLLSRDQIESLSQSCSWRHYTADQQVVGYKDFSRDVYFIISGTVRVKIFSLEGKEISYRDIGSGEIFGELAAIDGGMRSADVIALTDSQIARMSPETFWGVLRDQPGVAAELLRHLTKMIRMYSDRIFEFSALAVKNRIHAEILRLARSHLGPDNTAIIDPAPTHAEIASRISTHREAVTREINQLKRAGLVNHKSGALQVLDVRRLEQMVDEVMG
jgi:CRP-like cAMP-binding protein